MRSLKARPSAPPAGPVTTNIERDRGASKAIFCAQRSRRHPRRLRIADWTTSTGK